MRRNRLAPLAILATAAIAMAGTACGTDDNTRGGTAANANTNATLNKDQCATGTISGAGATFPATIIQQWIKDFGAACPGATINYQAVGSGAGIQQYTSGTVDFGASDVPMKADEQQAAEAKRGATLHIPWTAGGIAVEYNLEGIPDLKLSPQTLGGIYAGTITKWDAPAVRADNPDTKLPSLGIQVVHRSDGSGTTAVFTEYLAAAAPEVWKAGSGKDVKWPTGQGAKGSDGVTAAVKQTLGAIGYSEVSYAKGSSLGIAKIKNKAGSFVGPDAAAVSAALVEAAAGPDGRLKINYTPTGSTAYPISTTSYLLVPKQPGDQAKAKLLKAFVTYALGDGQDQADALHFAPLPTTLTASTKAAVESISA